MDNAGFLTYVSETDLRAVIEESYPGTKEIAPKADEDLLFEHMTDEKADIHFQAWKYSHPSRGDLWVVNKVAVTYED